MNSSTRTRITLAAPAWLLVVVTAAVGADFGAPFEGAPEGAHECLVEPDTVAGVGSSVQGVLSRLLVDRGDSVVRGQPLAELESDVERAALQLAEARAAMRSEIAAREADLELATLDLARLDDLHRQELVTAQQRDEATARRRVAGAALVQALENRELLLLELRRAHHLLAQRTLRSPVDGIVVERLAFPGEPVHDNPVVTVAAIDPLRVEVVLPVRQYGSLVKGGTARVYTELPADAPLVATIDAIDPVLDTGSGTFRVRLTLPNPELAVPGGQRCRVVFDGAPPIAAAAPPPAALSADGGG